MHYTTYTTPQLQLQLQLHYTNYTALQLQLKTTTPQLQLHLQPQLHYTTLHPAVVVRWPLQPLQPLQKHNSNHLSVHQWIRSANRDSQQPTSPIGLLSLKLPPPPCAVLLVYICTNYIAQYQLICQISLLMYQVSYVSFITSHHITLNHTTLIYIYTHTCMLFHRSPSLNLWYGFKWILFLRKSCN